MAAIANSTTLFPGLDYSSDRLWYGTSGEWQTDQAGSRKLVQGFPEVYTGVRAWTGSEMVAREDEWLMVLTEEDLYHVEKALRHFQSLELEPAHLSPTTFPLPENLSLRLKSLAHDCYTGRGFAVLRGVRPEAYTEVENVLLYGGISSHIAPVRAFQDSNRERITSHVMSEELKPGAEEEHLKPAFTNGRLHFHTDVGDILSLYTMDTASQGGSTMIVSSSTLYNEFAQGRPDLLEELTKPWVYFSKQDFGTDATSLLTNLEDDKLVFVYSRLPITGYREHGPNATLPVPTEKRLEAMSLMEELAWEHCFALPGERGDMAFINNMTLMHARDAFDLDASGKPLPSRRHLVKLMLKDPSLAWSLPKAIQAIHDYAYGVDIDGGSRKELWQLETSLADPFHGRQMWLGENACSNG